MIRKFLGEKMSLRAYWLFRATLKKINMIFICSYLFVSYLFVYIFVNCLTNRHPSHSCSAAFDLGLNGLHISHKKDAWLIGVKHEQTTDTFVELGSPFPGLGLNIDEMILNYSG